MKYWFSISIRQNILLTIRISFNIKLKLSSVTTLRFYRYSEPDGLTLLRSFRIELKSNCFCANYYVDVASPFVFACIHCFYIWIFELRFEYFNSTYKRARLYWRCINHFFLHISALLRFKRLFFMKFMCFSRIFRLFFRLP